VDPEQAYLAGLLHDWGRGLDGPALLREARARGLEVEPVALGRPVELLHAPVGAALLAERGVAPAVVEAVALHTVGEAGMSPLASLIYVADYCEPGRSHPGAAEVRALAWRDPTAAVRRAAWGTLSYLIASGAPLAQGTVRLWNHLAGEGGGEAGER
jgi:predicted HD superfamily hydrolase involved in NAD metabolism